MARTLSRMLAAAAVLFGAASMPSGATAQEAGAGQRPPASRCTLIARDLSNELPVRFVSMNGPRQLAQRDYKPETVTITYAGHSTYVIETPEGLRVATDYSGYYGNDPLPDVVTMNHAHSTHYTVTPDPAIGTVLRGWGDGSGPAEHYLPVGDMLIRNVPTDIRSGYMMEEGGNSIFIFEVADLCIGHLGHLHHELTDPHYGAIGRLDIVMIPVDGGLTLSHEAMAEVVQRLQSSIVLPMHRRYTTIDGFLDRVAGDFAIEYLSGRTIEVSIRDLPRQPTIMIPEGL